MDLTYKSYTTEIKQVADARSMHFLISTDAVDRDNDVLDPKGWQLDSYKANPIVAFAHDYKSLPIAKCTSIVTTPKGLEATAEFPPKGVHAFADTVYDMLKAGFLSATSVGFRPIDYEQATDRKGFNFKKQELTEFSIVPIPSNPQALVQQRGATSEQVKVWTKDLKDWMLKAEDVAPTKAQAHVTPLMKEGTVKPWAKDQAAWAAFEKDYDIEAESTELPVARVAKLLALHGFTEEASHLTKGDTQAALNLTQAHGAVMDAYANIHHAESIMSGLCSNGVDEPAQAQGRALSGGHMTRVKEAHAAMGRAKGHAMQAAQLLAAGSGEAVPKDLDAAVKKILDQEAADRQQAEDQAIVLTLMDSDPNLITMKDGDMQDALASFGPQLAEAIAGHTRDAMNKVLGRID